MDLDSGEYVPMNQTMGEARVSTKSDSINEVAAALCKAQAELKHPLKKNTAGSGSFSYTYADLPAVIDSIVAAFTKQGLSFTQFPSVDTKEKVVEVTTMLMHNSGQYLSSTIQMGLTDTKPQTIGSAITYARRYSLSAMAGIASETDDDGNSVGGIASKKVSSKGKVSFRGERN